MTTKPPTNKPNDKPRRKICVLGSRLVLIIIQPHSYSLLITYLGMLVGYIELYLVVYLFII